jgi:ferredoxin--NADP+ reductase
LAEYGIYPDKHKMKDGLRGQLHPILDLPNVRYFGNVLVGEDGDISLAELRSLGFQAVLVTAGAQGTKWLGLPGEDLKGVYHAKDVVYFYNKLPPYTQSSYLFGRRCAVIGAGNVMLDITHYLSRELKVEEVVAIVRRGPAEVKFDKKEMEYVIANLDMAALDAEIERVTPIMQAVKQDPAAARAAILEGLPKALPKVSNTRFRFEFLASPAGMIGDENGRLKQVELEDNILVEVNGSTKAKSTGNKRLLDVETVIFAIGDKGTIRLACLSNGASSSRIKAPDSPSKASPMKHPLRMFSSADGQDRQAWAWSVMRARTAPTQPGRSGSFCRSSSLESQMSRRSQSGSRNWANLLSPRKM